ncbi:MAG: ATP synthase F1 subunit gamma [Bacteroidales bacterium]
MANLKELRTRIATIRSTRKVTGSMKLVAASKLRGVQDHILHLREYAGKLRQVLGEVIIRLSSPRSHPFMQPGASKSVLLICVGSDKGLCGTYNLEVIRETLRQMEALQEEGYKVRLMVLGKKPARFFELREFEMEAIDGEIMRKVSYQSADAFARQISDLYLKASFARVLFVYNRFVNAVIHDITTEQFLPLSVERLSGKSPQDRAEAGEVILEPARDDVVDYLTLQYVSYNCYRILLDASASEHGSRMTAMHNASDNADDMLKDLNLRYNKARQAMVTKELMDIMGGQGTRTV